MNGRPRHWLNPHYHRSETETSSCRQTPSPHDSSHRSFTSSVSLRTEAKMKNILTCLPKSWTKLNNLTCSFTSIFTSRSEPKVEKEIVMEGVLPTTKASLMSFLKGMGLRPKVELVGQETIISADMSVINDENLKKKFLDIIKMQVIESPDANGNADISTSNTSDSCKIPSSPKNTEEAPLQRRKSRKSMDSLPPGLFKPLKPGEPLPPGLFKTPKSEEADRRANLEPHRTAMDSLPPGLFKPHKPGEPLPPGLFKTPKSEEADRRANLEPHRTSKLSIPPGLFKPLRPNGTLPPGLYKTEHQSIRDAGRSSTASDPFPPGPFLPDNPSEPLSPGPFKPRKTTADSLPPVPWAPKKKAANDQQKPDQSEGHNSSGKDRKGNVSFAMHQKSHVSPNIHFWDDPADLKVEQNEKKKKPKKLRIVKHLRRWILRTKKTATPCVSACNVTQNREDSTTSKNRVSERLREERTQDNDAEGGSKPMIEQRFQTHPARNLNGTACQRKPMKPSVGDKKPLQAYDGSISMPVLITPDKSCFKAKIPTKREMVEGSKSSTKAGGRLEDEQTTYSVVGNSAAIHIAKNRIRLEGKDVKYGSILHKDKHFDDHFKVLQDNSLQDIEYQVNKVKERIMFARAIDSVGGNKSEDAPEVNLKALLWPGKNDSGKTKKIQVDVVTKSSFYQKFLASMNILKCTNRTDACDRSVMTDEPLSRTYAEFISATAARSRENRVRLSKKRSNYAKEIHIGGDAASIGDSSCDLPTKSYMTKICQCWEPLLFFRREPHEQNYRRFEPYKTEDEKIFKCVVNKVIDSSRNKKKGYIKTGILQ